ncbi:autophagy protein 12, partial [Nadsonia fulvescens var. elongata DSM 6958]
DRKIAIRFRPIGGAPALVNVGLCRISANERWSAVIKFLSRRLLPSRDRNRTETVFCYIANSFAPSPDSQVGNVFDSYQIDDELMVSYCLVQAFG